MGRGAQQQTRQLTDQQLALQNQMLGQENQQTQQDRTLLMPTISSLLTTPGYSAAQQNAITQEGMGSARTAYDSLAQSAQNQVTRTNNSAGFNDLTAQLGRSEAQNLAQQARQNQITFANDAQSQQLAGLSALGQTYGINTNLLGKSMGIPAQLLGVRSSASGNPDYSSFGGLFGSLGLGLGSLFG
jgi:predicted alpha/beta hydrolase